MPVENHVQRSRGNPSSTPILIITCKPGGELKASLEIGDALFKYDTTVRVEPQGHHRGVVLVWSKLPPYKAYALLVSQVLSYPYRIVPLFPDPHQLKPLVTKLREQIACVNIRCEARGALDKCNELTLKALTTLGLRMCRKKREGKHTLHIEGADDIIGYSILPDNCDNYNKTLQDNNHKRKCIEFAHKANKTLETNTTNNP